jgi:gliding motility-associated-like protein
LQPGLTEVCLPTNVPSLSPFHLDLNTQPYEEDVNECVDLVYFYNANFDNPPYKMTEWTYRGNKVTDFNFTNASELVAFMNSLDPIGNWSLSEDENRIIGGAPGSIYGKIQVEYSGNMTEELLANTLSVSHPSIFVGNVPSAHIFVVTEQQSGCQDTLYINLLSLDTLEQNQDTITVILPVGEVDTICLSLEELPGLPELISNQCFSTYNAQVQATGSDPCVIVTGLQPGDDQACLVLCDNLGKCDTTILLIEVRDTSTELIIFNGFSPNEDGVNDFFRIKNIELYPNNTLKIFNRWGNTVFETTGYRNYWDAIYKNTYLPDGTYFYFLEVEINGVMKTFSGFVEVRK